MIPDQVGMARIGLQQSIDLCRDTSRILNTEAPRRLRRSGSRRARNGREVRRIEPETGGIGVHQIAHALVSESVPRAPQQVRVAHAIRAACVEVFFWVPIDSDPRLSGRSGISFVSGRLRGPYAREGCGFPSSIDIRDRRLGARCGFVVGGSR
jgi:hypothetical protein